MDRKGLTYYLFCKDNYFSWIANALLIPSFLKSIFWNLGFNYAFAVSFMSLYEA